MDFPDPWLRNLNEQLKRFKKHTGCQMLLSRFYLRREPIVYTPADACHCSIARDLDVLAACICFLTNQAQDPRPKLDC